MTAPAALHHLCPGGCGHLILPRKLACPSCWRRLPAGVRGAIVTASVGRHDHPAAHAAAVAAALEWLGQNPRDVR